MANGWIDSKELKWQSDHKKKIKDFSESKLEETLVTIDEIYAGLYKEHPFKISLNTENIVEKIINNDNLNSTFNLSN